MSFPTTTYTLGYLQMLVSGLHIAWGIWRVDFRIESWYRSANGTFIFIVMSFYVGALIGGIMSGCVVNIWRKQPIYVNSMSDNRLIFLDIQMLLSFCSI